MKPSIGSRLPATNSGGAPHPGELALRLPGGSAAMRAVRRRVIGLAPLDHVPVLITGPSGSDAERLVEVIHALSPRADRALIRFPGPSRAATARAAPGGALYVERLCDLDAKSQAYLRSLVFARLETTATPRRKRIRIYASCSEGRLGDALESGALDRTLVRELARFSIALPPLRERLADLREVVPQLCREFGAALGRPAARVTKGGLTRLKTHAWPGDMEELSQLLERGIAFSADGRITKRQIDELLREGGGDLALPHPPTKPAERDRLREMLEEAGGNVSEVARRLGLSRSTLQYRVEKAGLGKAGLGKTRG